MKPQDRADADMLWKLYARLAGTSVELMTAPHPTVATEVLTISAPAMLLLARDRQYWRDAAEAAIQPPEQPRPAPAHAAPSAPKPPPIAAAEPAAAMAAAPADAGLKPKAPVSAASVVTPSPRPMRPSAGVQHTPERMQLVAKIWMDPELSLQQVLEQVNGLPGPAVPQTARLYRWADQLGLPTKRPARVPTTQRPVAAEPQPKPELEAKQADPVVAAPPPPAAPLPQAAPPPVSAEMPAAAAPARRPIRPDDIWDDAREMLRDGKDVIVVADETGLTTGQVRDLKFAMQNPGKPKGGA